MLNESKLTATGTMKHPGTGEEVKGTFAWTNPEAKPGAAGDYTASWTFTPAEGYEEYATATGTVKVKVKPAKLTVSVKASRAYYTGEAQIASIIASGQSVDSTSVTFTYSDKVDGNYTSDRSEHSPTRVRTPLTTRRKPRTTNQLPRYVHRDHRPAADQPSLCFVNLQDLRRQCRCHAYCGQADVLQQNGESPGYHTSQYGALLLKRPIYQAAGGRELSALAGGRGRKGAFLHHDAHKQ